MTSTDHLHVSATDSVCVLCILGPHSPLSLGLVLPYPLSEVPVTFVRGPQDLEVTEGDTATFECELSQTLADAVWEKVRAWP